MTRPSLAGIEQRAAAATAGPWFQGRNGRSFEGTCDVYSRREPDEPDSHDIATYMYSEEDAAFIVAARTAVDALTAAVRDVLALHTDGGQSQGYTDDAPGGYGYIDHCCTECGSFGEFGEPWPCPTVRALAAHLDLTDPEGDPT